MLGHLEEAVSLYVTHTDVDEETARAVVAEARRGELSWQRADPRCRFAAVKR